MRGQIHPKPLKYPMIPQLCETHSVLVLGGLGHVTKIEPAWPSFQLNSFVLSISPLRRFVLKANLFPILVLIMVFILKASNISRLPACSQLDYLVISEERCLKLHGGGGRIWDNFPKSMFVIWRLPWLLNGAIKGNHQWRRFSVNMDAIKFHSSFTLFIKIEISNTVITIIMILAKTCIAGAC